MKNNTFFKLFIITIFALILRLWHLDKPEGLWNDEYVSWYIASENNIIQLFKDIFSNCHTPLYYFYLKLWMLFLGDSDISLRLSSVIPSICAIPLMYKIGEKLYNQEAAFLCAFITSISSFCIYFAQEVRLYSLLFLFSSIVILYFVKSIQNKSKLNYILFFISNALLCTCHTLGIIFSFFIISAFIIHIISGYDNIKSRIKSLLEIGKYILPFLLVILILSPLLYTVASSKSLSQFWSDFSVYKIIYTFIDYYSPVQTNISNSPNSILPYIFNQNKIEYSFIIFAILPFLIGIFSLIQSLRQKIRILNLLIFSSLLYFITLIIISISGKMLLSTKYSIEIYPVLIVGFSVGILSVRNNFIKYFVLITFILLNLIYLLFSPTASHRLTREEGHLAPVKLLEYSRLKPGDNVILTYYDVDKFERYLSDKNLYNFTSINKFNFNYIMFNNNDYFEVIHHGKDMYKDYFKEYPNPVILKFSHDYFITKMNKGDKLGILFLDNVSFISNTNIQEIIRNESEYERTPFIFLAFSALKNNLMYSFKQNYKIDSITQSGSWTLIVYEKIN